LVEIEALTDFFFKILKKSLQIGIFADFLSNFYDFLHFWRFLRFKNSILCKFADKIAYFL